MFSIEKGDYNFHFPIFAPFRFLNLISDHV